MKTRTIIYILLILLFVSNYTSCTYDKLGGIGPKLKTFCDSVTITYNIDVVAITNLHCGDPGSCHYYLPNYNILQKWVNTGVFQKRTFSLKDMPPPNNVQNFPPLTDLELKKIGMLDNCGLS